MRPPRRSHCFKQMLNMFDIPMIIKEAVEKKDKI